MDMVKSFESATSLGANPSASNDVTTTLKVDELESLLEQDNYVKIAGTDIDGVLRGKTVKKHKFLSIIRSSSGIKFCSVVFGWDLHDQAYAGLSKAEIANQSNGYADLIAEPDLDTFRRLSRENFMPFFLVDFVKDSWGNGIHVCPRTLLKNIVQQAHSMGFRAKAAIEYEFYNYLETPESLKTKHYDQLKPLTPGMFGYSLLRPTLHAGYVDSIMKACEALRVPIESFHTETGK